LDFFALLRSLGIATRGRRPRVSDDEPVDQSGGTDTWTWRGSSGSRRRAGVIVRLCARARNTSAQWGLYQPVP